MELGDVTERRPLLEDAMAKLLVPGIRDAARRLSSARGRRSAIVRFHHDADGISGALALAEIFRFFAKQQNSAVYTVRDAIRDLSDLAHEEGPMVVLLDFGINEASVEALKLLKAGGITVVAIDHHPPSGGAEKIPDLCVTPWEFPDEKTPSAYVAGYIACEIAVACGADRERMLSLARTACAGDKSAILESGPEDRKAALVLDFLAAHTSFGNNLDFYRKVMGSDELFSSIARQAEDSIAEAASKAMAGMKRGESGLLETVAIPLERVVVRGEWPPSSKVTTHVFESISGERPLLCVGYNERSLILRLNDAAVALGLGANTLADALKATMPDFVEGGGGHAKAGAIRVREGFVKDVLNELLREAAARAAPRKD